MASRVLMQCKDCTSLRSDCWDGGIAGVAVGRVS